MWKQIEGYENYEVNHEGQVRNRLNGRILRISYDRRGYEKITLNKGRGIRKTFPIHRLVAEYFIPNPDGKIQVNHIDGVKTNNHISNLEWVTNTENMQHAKAHNLNRSRPVEQYDLNENYIRTYKSLTEASIAINGDTSMIARVCKGKRKMTHGYKWRYSDKGK